MSNQKKNPEKLIDWSETVICIHILKDVPS